LLLKSGKENFNNTTRYLGDDDLVFKKGQYPYNYMCDRSKFYETSLPSRENFYNSLNEHECSPEDYQHAVDTWNCFGIKTMQEYHDHYLLLDVLLLADVFSHFRRNVLQNHGLDCLYYPTLPSLAWDMALKNTGVEPELLTDPEQYLMVERAIRGGISTISTRYGKANNPLIEGFDPSQPTKYVMYWDMNNLYGYAESQYLPLNNFRFLSPDEITSLDLMSISAESPIGYIYDCDIEYPVDKHDEHSQYPLAPEHLAVKSEMLSPVAKNLQSDIWTSASKLIPNLYDKIHYVTHYRNLQFYIKQGLVLKKKFIASFRFRSPTGCVRG